MWRFSYTGAMKQEFSPRRLDLKALARAKGKLSGESPLADFERLKGEAQGLSENPVTWAASGEMRPSEIGGDQVWLHLTARTTLSLVCQRCMRPVDTLIAADRWFRFAPDEATAAALDDESDEDVLVLDGAFDLLSLVEDELLMSLPLVPRHEQCPVDIKLAVADPDFVADAAKPNPFARLASLRVDKTG
mgnify:CR=1 FL=1